MDKQGNGPTKPLSVTRREALKKLGVGLAGALLAPTLLEDKARAHGSSRGYLLVSSFSTDSVLRYDELTGAFVDAFVPFRSGGLREPFGVIFGPDGNLYVASGQESDTGTGHKFIARYDGSTGAFIDVFADANALQSPRQVLFGPDGNLYVADGYSGTVDRVARFDGTTGAFLDYFIPPGSGGLANPLGMVFGPNGKDDGKLDLYVTATFKGTVLRYDGTTGAFKGVFVAPNDGGLINPAGIVFGPDGNLYVANCNLIRTPGSILVYQGPYSRNPGAFLGTFVAWGSGGLAQPYGLLFGPGDRTSGVPDLYVADDQLYWKNSLQSVSGTSQVLRYDGRTGAFKAVFVSPESGGLRTPIFATFTETNPTTLNYRT